MIDYAALVKNMNILGEFLKNRRMKLELSLQQVADASGCTKAHLWEIEQGKTRNPRVKLAARLANTLGVPILEIANRATDKRRSVA